MTEIVSPSGLQMLPLIVGGPDEKEDDIVLDDTVEDVEVDIPDAELVDDPVVVLTEEIKK